MITRPKLLTILSFLFIFLLYSTPAATADAAYNYDLLMEGLWNGAMGFRHIVKMQIETQPANGNKPFVNGMDEGTQIVPMQVGGNSVWYLFNREYDFAPRPPQCRAFARIVVRESTDKGKTWSREVVVATPNLEQGECVLGDSYTYWDAAKGTWHCLAQMFNGNGWNINHFTRQNTESHGKLYSRRSKPCGQG